MKLTEEQLKNKDLIKEYPWLIPRNRFTGEIPKDYDYSYTELDAMPKGWKEAFSLDLCKELKQALGKYNKEYRISQIKEKWGSLCWYDFGNTPTGYEIIRKYEKLSMQTCINCGKPAEHLTSGYIMPLCHECWLQECFLNKQVKKEE